MLPLPLILVTTLALFGNVLATMSLKDVLVVVKHNSPTKPEQVKKHYEFMSQIFPHIKIHGPWKGTEMETLLENNLPVYLSPKDDEWYLTKTSNVSKPGTVAYRSVLMEMKNPPRSKYAGYLFMHDDLAMDIKKLQTLNLSVPWVAYDSQGSPTIHAINETQWRNLSASWNWFNQEMGILALDRIYNTYPSIKERIAKCTGHPHTIPTGKGDFFYIPNNHITKLFLKFGGIFQANRLFLEIAIPLFMECFIKPYEAVHLKFCTRTGNPLKESLPLIQKICNGSDVVHPLKLSHPAMWEIYEAVSNIK